MKTKYLSVFLIIFMVFISFVIGQLRYQCGSSIEYCRDDQTCCLMSEDHYGCCPYLRGVCCEDGQHCCPQNYVCNLTKLRCERQGEESFLEFLMLEDNNFGSNDNKTSIKRIYGAEMDWNKFRK